MLNIVRFFSLIRYVVSEYLVIEEDNDVSLKNVLCYRTFSKAQNSHKKDDDEMPNIPASWLCPWCPIAGVGYGIWISNLLYFCSNRIIDRFINSTALGHLCLCRCARWRWSAAAPRPRRPASARARRTRSPAAAWTWPSGLAWPPWPPSPRPHLTQPRSWPCLCPPVSVVTWGRIRPLAARQNSTPRWSTINL